MQYLDLRYMQAASLGSSQNSQSTLCLLECDDVGNLTFGNFNTFLGYCEVISSDR